MFNVLKRIAKALEQNNMIQNQIAEDIRTQRLYLGAIHAILREDHEFKFKIPQLIQEKK
jgi:hypothetical protein